MTILVVVGVVVLGVGATAIYLADVRYRRKVRIWQQSQRRKRGRRPSYSYADHYKHLFGTPPIHSQQVTHQQDLKDQYEGDPQ